jgi:purine-binding chemotaxis protein CheW
MSQGASRRHGLQDSNNSMDTMTADTAEVARTAGTRTEHASGQGGEFLSFRLGAEEYGIDILKVQEIRSYEPPTRIANAPAFVKGVINLRGVIVPIVDLRVKLGCEAVEYNGFTVVIVLNVKGRVVGTVVDSVSDVLELGGDAIRPAPEMSCSVDSRCITGIGSVTGRMLILLDIEALLTGADMGLFDPRA